MNFANMETQGSNVQKAREKFAEIETRLRRQMVVNPKHLLIAGSFSLPKAAVHVHSAGLGTPFYLSVAVASVGIGWLSGRWWKEKKLRAPTS